MYAFFFIRAAPDPVTKSLTWDKHKQGTAFEGAQRRANVSESLTSNRGK